MTVPSRRPSATIVAFDGLVADTLPARALAVADAVTAEIAPCTRDDAMAFVRGRSLDEAIEQALSAHAASAGIEFDATIRDLAVLRARRSYSAMVAQQLPLCDGAEPWMSARAMDHGRVVLRADSARRDVEQLIAFTRLQDGVAFIRCADDLPRRVGASSLESAWSAIESRLTSQRILLQDCTVFECSELAADAARRHVPDVRIVVALASA